MERIDKEIVNRGIVDSRVKAQELIKQGMVKINNKVITKSSLQVSELDKIDVVDNTIFKYVSRGGFKLEKALDVFNYDVKNKCVMDIGSSTGGFTDCCLQRGAGRMVCIDVGTDVMHPSIRKNPKVNLYENTNFKDISETMFDGVDLAVVDVSFISLSKIFSKIKSYDVKLDIICLIKPQFECGREIATKYSGIILNKDIHKSILNNLVSNFDSLGFVCNGVDYSPVKGGDGNIEYLGYFTNKDNNNDNINIDNIVKDAFDSFNK